MIDSINGFEVNCPGDEVDLVDAELIVFDFGRDVNAWVAASSYAVCAKDGDPFAPILAKRLLAVYPRCRDRDGNEREFFDLFGGPPEASPPFEFLRRLAVKAPPTATVSPVGRRARDGGPPTL